MPVFSCIALSLSFILYLTTVITVQYKIVERWNIMYLPNINWYGMAFKVQWYEYIFSLCYILEDLTPCIYIVKYFVTKILGNNHSINYFLYPLQHIICLWFCNVVKICFLGWSFILFIKYLFITDPLPNITFLLHRYIDSHVWLNIWLHFIYDLYIYYVFTTVIS